MPCSQITHLEIENLKRPIKVQLKGGVTLDERINRGDLVFKGDLTQAHTVASWSAALSSTPIVGEGQLDIAGCDWLGKGMGIAQVGTETRRERG
ncbi:MAG: hypothetical protein AAGM22_25745 [Acidobacteriota bacterium]